MDYYLHDHPNPHGRFYYPSRRRCQHGIDGPHLIVLHSAENLPDFDPPDMGAENVAKYASTTQRSVSWHHTVDSDSIIEMLPADYTAWHVRGFNRCSVGIEIATQHDAWLRSPEPWLYQVYDNVADVLKFYKATNGIPLVDRRGDPSKWGVTTHAVLDPSRRKDPGKAFPFEWVVWMAENDWRYGGTSTPSPDTPPPPQPPVERPIGKVSLLGAPSVQLLSMQDWGRSHGGSELFIALAQVAYAFSLHYGVDPAVPYAIMAHETNFGKFTGVLDETFNNWGGIKKVSGGGDYDPEAHHRFNSHEEGVRAVVEHVAGYAGLAVHNPIDPRFFLITNKRIESIPDLGWTWAKETHDDKVATFVHEMRDQ